MSGLLDGRVVNIDKPRGPSSHQVASWVADITEVKKASHTGTLDPVVTGCLPFFLGKASRVAGMFQGDDKRYVFTIELHKDVSRGELERVLDEFEGVIYQKPPVKSGVKRRVRKREVYSLDLLEFDDEKNRGLIECRCEAGTYIRKLCHDIGLVMDTGAHMKELRRTGSGDFDVEDSIYLQSLKDAVAKAEEGDDSFLREVSTPLYDVLEKKGMDFVVVKESVKDSLSNGSPVYGPGIKRCGGSGTVAAVTESHELLAVGEMEKDVFRPSKVLI